MASVERLAKKLARQEQFLLQLEVDEDDSEDIAAALKRKFAAPAAAAAAPVPVAVAVAPAAAVYPVSAPAYYASPVPAKVCECPPPC